MKKAIPGCVFCGLALPFERICVYLLSNLMFRIFSLIISVYYEIVNYVDTIKLKEAVL